MGREVTISILDLIRARNAKRKTPEKPSTRAKYLERRGDSGIRIYDCGYYTLDGTNYVNLPFVDPHSTDPITNSGTFDSLTLAYYDQIKDLVLGISQEDWKTTFMQVGSRYVEDYGNPFGSSPVVGYKGTLYSLDSPAVFDGDKFMPNGAEPSNTFGVLLHAALCRGFNINGSATIKVTSAPDYAEAEVSFTPSKTMDVFLMPVLVKVRVVAVHTRTGGPLPIPITQIHDHLDQLRFIYPREVFHNESLDVYGEFLGGTLEWEAGSVSTDPYEDTWRWVNYWKSFGGLRAGRLSTTFTWSVLDPADFATLAMYPEPPSEPPDPTTFSLGIDLQTIAPETPPNGSLAAVIKQGSTYYYVWQDA